MPPRPSEDSLPARPLRVLVVESHAEAADAWARQLGLLGHEPRTAPDGPAALEASRAHPPDVVLLTLDLPGDMDGWQFARRLQEQPAGKRPLLIAFGGEQHPSHGPEAGIDLHLPRPMDLARLRKLLGRFHRIIC